MHISMVQHESMSMCIVLRRKTKTRQTRESNRIISRLFSVAGISNSSSAMSSKLALLGLCFLSISPSFFKNPAAPAYPTRTVRPARMANHELLEGCERWLANPWAEDFDIEGAFSEVGSFRSKTSFPGFPMFSPTGPRRSIWKKTSRILNLI